MSIWYSTRESVKDALGAGDIALNTARIDRAIGDASRTIDNTTHRTFYPELATKLFPWPTGAEPWRLWLDNHELIRLDSIRSGGIELPIGDVLLEPVNDGPPFDRVEIDRASRSAFSVGESDQRSVELSGLFGGAPDDADPAGALVATISDSAAELTVPDSTLVGIGSLVRADDERVVIWRKTYVATGLTLAAGLFDLPNAAVVTLSGTAAAPEPGEPILIDGERMHVIDRNGTQLLVRRARDGTPLAAHLIGAAVSAPRLCGIRRAVLGTVAAEHTAGAALTVWRPPEPVTSLAIEMSISQLQSESSGMARTAGSGNNEREVSGNQLAAKWKQVRANYQRMARIRRV